jgi:hypothetical protein
MAIKLTDIKEQCKLYKIHITYYGENKKRKYYNKKQLVKMLDDKKKELNIKNEVKIPNKKVDSIIVKFCF